MICPRAVTATGQVSLQFSTANFVSAGLMLQKQTPASTIPRFNPHGYQAPPQERKVEETSPKKSFGVVKKRDDKDKMVDFKKFNIEELLFEKVSQYTVKFKFIFFHRAPFL